MKKLALCCFLLFCLLPSVAANAQGDPSSSGNCSTNPCTTTYHANNSRNGLNGHETVLVANSSTWESTFGATPAQVQVDGQVYAQPLYVWNVAWTGGTGTGCPTASTKKMVYVVTEANTIYAIDADNYGICAHASLNTANGGGVTDTAIPVAALPGGPCNNITGSTMYGTIGVTGTPAIDPGNNIMFVISAHKVVNGSNTAYTQRLNAVNITNLSVLTSQLDVQNSINTAGSGYPSFDARNESQRSGLLLTSSGTSGVNIYGAWSSFCDSNISGTGSFGIVAEFDFDYSNNTFGSTTESFYAQGTHTNKDWNPVAPAGVWMAGGAPAADVGGNVYVSVGNGNFEGVVANGLNFGNSIVKLGGSTFRVVEDYYTPNVWSQLNNGSTGIACSGSGSYCAATGYLCKTANSCKITLNSADWDLGSGGVVLLTTSSSSTYGELLGAGKEGMFYVTYYCSSQGNCPTGSWNSLMGGLDGGGYGTDAGSLYSSVSCSVSSSTNPAPGTGEIAQCFYGAPLVTSAETGGRSTPAFWPGSTPYLYTVGSNDVLRARAFNTSTGIFDEPADATSTNTVGYPGATPTISSNGNDFSSAVVWVLQTKGVVTGAATGLAAFAAKPPTGSTTLTQLWPTSGMASGPGATTFMTPTVAHGKVYVGGQQSGGCGLSSCGGYLYIYY